MIHQRRHEVIQKLIRAYDGQEPLPIYLKRYFRQHRNMGSTDRRTIASFVYPYFRLGRALDACPAAERLAIGNLLCQRERSPLLDYALSSQTTLDPGLAGAGLEEKVSHIMEKYPGFSVSDVFPFTSPLSDGLDLSAVAASMLMPPLVWIRVRPGREKSVAKAVKEAGLEILHNMEGGRTLAFAPGTKLTTLVPFDRGGFEIQDLSSQRTGKYMEAGTDELWWDMCGGAGGKTLMLKSRIPELNVFLTDRRDGILQSAVKRFRKAGVSGVTVVKADLNRDPVPHGFPASFDGIILDAPCSGSGSWARTPERITTFRENEIGSYARLQRKLIDVASARLKAGGQLVYITCSVFREENEGAVDHAKAIDLQCVKTVLLNGIPERAECLFVAVMKKQPDQ